MEVFFHAHIVAYDNRFDQVGINIFTGKFCQNACKFNMFMNISWCV